MLGKDCPSSLMISSSERALSFTTILWSLAASQATYFFFLTLHLNVSLYFHSARNWIGYVTKYPYKLFDYITFLFNVRLLWYKKIPFPHISTHFLMATVHWVHVQLTKENLFTIHGQINGLSMEWLNRKMQVNRTQDIIRSPHRNPSPSLAVLLIVWQLHDIPQRTCWTSGQGSARD